MEQKPENNSALLRGVLGGRPVYSHSCRGLDFFTFPLEIRRLSGTVDRVNLVLRKELAESLVLGEGDKLQISGQVRSFNDRSGRGAKLVISVYVLQLDLAQGEDENRIRLSGTLCKPPVLRRTPLGREICDLMLAVNRSCGRSDYLPCICWGRHAREAADWPVGTRLSLEGRLQSRLYLKQSPEGTLERTAFEISARSVAPEAFPETVAPAPVFS